MYPSPIMLKTKDTISLSKKRIYAFFLQDLDNEIALKIFLLPQEGETSTYAWPGGNCKELHLHLNPWGCKKNIRRLMQFPVLIFSFWKSIWPRGKKVLWCTPWAGNSLPLSIFQRPEPKLSWRKRSGGESYVFIFFILGWNKALCRSMRAVVI